MEITTNNLQLNSQIMKTTSSFANTQNSKGAVYAEEGDPMYQKDMDKDEDGIITFDEFNDYCDENDISYAQRKQMLQDRLEYQLHTEYAKVSAEIRKIKPEVKDVEKEESDKDESEDKQVDEESEAEDEPQIDFEEYMKYCETLEEKALEEGSKEDAENNENEVVFKHFADAISSYVKTEKGEKQGLIQSKA